MRSPVFHRVRRHAWRWAKLLGIAAVGLAEDASAQDLFGADLAAEQSHNTDGAPVKHGVFVLENLLGVEPPPPPDIPPLDDAKTGSMRSRTVREQLVVLYTAMLDRAGVKAERVGDSTGRLDDV